MFSNIFSSLIYQGNISIVFIFREKSKKQNENTVDDYNHLLCRFVLDGTGRKIGESIAIDEDILIIKSGKKYLGVPLKHIKEDKKTLLVQGLVEQDKAEIMGEKWRRESFQEIDYGIGNNDGF